MLQIIKRHIFIELEEQVEMINMVLQ